MLSSEKPNQLSKVKTCLKKSDGNKGNSNGRFFPPLPVYFSSPERKDKQQNFGKRGEENLHTHSEEHFPWVTRKGRCDILAALFRGAASHREGAGTLLSRTVRCALSDLLTELQCVLIYFKNRLKGSELAQKLWRRTETNTNCLVVRLKPAPSCGRP